MLRVVGLLQDFTGPACTPCPARNLHEQLRQQDLLARLGGEEFAVVLPGIALDEARLIAERLRRRVEAMILATTLTVDSDYVRDIQKERFSTPLLLLLLKLVPAKTEMKLLLKKSVGFLKCESEADQSYGRGFYETVASDLNYKKRFIHSFRCVYMLKDYPPFQANDFEYLRGRIQILLPENDIFKKEDQNRFAQLFRKLDAEIRTVPGGHVGFIVQSERYLDLMEAFLRKIF